MSSTKGLTVTTPSVAVPLRRWGITLTATIATTYALDAFATAAGLALAATLGRMHATTVGRARPTIG